MRVTRRLFMAGLLALPGASALAWRWHRQRARRWDPSSPEILARAAEAIIGLSIETSRYADYFRWRGANIPSARRLYAAFLGAVRDEARASNVDFLAAEPASRRVVLARVASSPEHASDARAVRAEILALFARTDAWIHLGYESWPGTARGFEGLDRLPVPRPRTARS